jgi:hypothetical protein
VTLCVTAGLGTMKAGAVEHSASSARYEVAQSDIDSESEARLASDVVIGRSNGVEAIQK